MDLAEQKAVMVLGGVVLAFVLGFIGLVREIQELLIPGQLAKIEQLREDVVRVGSGANRNVIGQVTQWNQEIRAAKRYRMVWWGRLWKPEEWESVDVIKIP